MIGVAIFREKPASVGVLRPLRERVDAAPDASPAPPALASEASPAARAAAPEPVAKMPALPRPDVAAQGSLTRVPREPAERLGTGHGERETSIVVDTTFDRLAPRPQEVVRIRYDSLPNLVAAGIAPPVVAQVPPRLPRAFPGDAEPGFVPDPPSR